jgi:sec-independent protein translocase protein TatC
MGVTSERKNSLDTTMSLGDHLEELRLRVILALAGFVLAFILAVSFGKAIILFIEGPYVGVMGSDARLQSLAPADGFTTYMEISMIAAIVFSSPWIFYQMWMFVGTGLYPHEKRYVYIAIPFSAGLFITGALFFMLVIAPTTLKFLVMFNKEVLSVASNFTFKDYVSFINVMMLVFGIAFQTPIAIFFLNRTGLVSIGAFQRSRKFVMLGIVVLAAVATPSSDIFSLFALAIPIYMLFELGIFLSYLSNRRLKKKSAG